MASGRPSTPLRPVRTLFCAGAMGGVGDRQLLERFNARREPESAEAAFEAIVTRHGPMVLGICRRVLADSHAAEDAFQATFLVLVRRAGSIAQPELLGHWLYGVAYRTAREARARAARRRAKEASVGKRAGGFAPNEDTWLDLQPILDEELSRLPEKYRVPVVLCELEGLSRAEVARRLGLPEGTVSSRLSRARATLRERLERRGLTLSAAALAASLSRDTAASAVPAALAESTIRTAARVAVGDTVAEAAKASVASLAEGVIKIMFISKLKMGAFAVVALGVAVTGVGVLAQSEVPATAVGPNDDNRPGSAQVSPAGGDRLKALEDKIDRLINALESRAQPGQQAANMAMPGFRPAPNANMPGGPFVVRDAGAGSPYSRNNLAEQSDSKRLHDLEQRMREVERKLDEVHRGVFVGGRGQPNPYLPESQSAPQDVSNPNTAGQPVNVPRRR